MRVTVAAWALAGAAACVQARQTGEPCQDKTECQGGLCIQEHVRDEPTGWKGGTCSGTCTADQDCGTGKVCRTLDDENHCLQGCQRANQCRNGYVCHPTWGACIPSCLNDGWRCQDGTACRANGLCVVGIIDSPGGNAMGGPCVAAADCSSRYCIDGVTAVAWTDGYCSAPCPDGAACPDGSSCWPLLDGSYCLDSCGYMDGCRNTYVCDTDWNVCLPDCRLGWPCQPGQVCNGRGVCVQRP
jgi:hypothetical protein